MRFTALCPTCRGRGHGDFRGAGDMDPGLCHTCEGSGAVIADVVGPAAQLTPALLPVAQPIIATAETY